MVKLRKIVTGKPTGSLAYFTKPKPKKKQITVVDNPIPQLPSTPSPNAKPTPIFTVDKPIPPLLGPIDPQPQILIARPQDPNTPESVLESQTRDYLRDFNPNAPISAEEKARRLALIGDKGTSSDKPQPQTQQSQTAEPIKQSASIITETPVNTGKQHGPPSPAEQKQIQEAENNRVKEPIIKSTKPPNAVLEPVQPNTAITETTKRPIGPILIDEKTDSNNNSVVDNSVEPEIIRNDPKITEIINRRDTELADFEQTEKKLQSAQALYTALYELLKNTKTQTVGIDPRTPKAEANRAVIKQLNEKLTELEKIIKNTKQDHKKERNEFKTIQSKLYDALKLKERTIKNEIKALEKSIKDNQTTAKLESEWSNIERQQRKLKTTKNDYAGLVTARKENKPVTATAVFLNQAQYFIPVYGTVKQVIDVVKSWKHLTPAQRTKAIAGIGLSTAFDALLVVPGLGLIGRAGQLTTNATRRAATSIATRRLNATQLLRTNLTNQLAKQTDELAQLSSTTHGSFSATSVNLRNSITKIEKELAELSTNQTNAELGLRTIGQNTRNLSQSALRAQNRLTTGTTGSINNASARATQVGAAGLLLAETPTLARNLQDNDIKRSLTNNLLPIIAGIGVGIGTGATPNTIRILSKTKFTPTIKNGKIVFNVADDFADDIINLKLLSNGESAQIKHQQTIDTIYTKFDDFMNYEKEKIFKIILNSDELTNYQKTELINNLTTQIQQQTNHINQLQKTGQLELPMLSDTPTQRVVSPQVINDITLPTYKRAVETAIPISTVKITQTELAPPQVSSKPQPKLQIPAEITITKPNEVLTEEVLTEAEQSQQPAEITIIKPDKISVKETQVKPSKQIALTSKTEPTTAPQPQANSNIDPLVNAKTKPETKTKATLKTNVKVKVKTKVKLNTKTKPPKKSKKTKPKSNSNLKLPKPIKVKKGYIPSLVGWRQGLVEIKANFDKLNLPAVVGGDHPEIPNDPKKTPYETLTIIKERKLTKLEKKELENAGVLKREVTVAHGKINAIRLKNDGKYNRIAFYHKPKKKQKHKKQIKQRGIRVALNMKGN